MEKKMNKMDKSKICVFFSITIAIIIGFSFLFNGESGFDVKGSQANIENGNVWYVGGTGPNNYTTIQAAINDANTGDTIFVFNDSSPYKENIVIRKSVNLVGENRFSTVINGSGSGE